MGSKLGQCAIVLRRLDRGGRVSETSVVVSSIEELYEVCLSLPDPDLVERLVLAGRDGEGRRRLLSFSFQSSASPGEAQPRPVKRRSENH